MRNSKVGSMKLAFAVTALLMIQSVVVFAQSNVQLALYKPNTKIAQIKVENIKPEESVSITIRDAQGVVLFSDRNKEATYVKLLDFDKISTGTYTIDIAESERVVRKVVVKDENALSIKDDSFYFSNFIQLKEEDKKLFVRFNNNMKAPVTVRITDSNGHILHEESGINAESYATLFNLTKLTKGKYNMSFSSGGVSSNRAFQL